jgi:F-type H+-transporting ATPase subunit b
MIEKRVKVVHFLPILIMGLPAVASGGEHGFNVTMFIAQIVNFLIFFGGLGYMLSGTVVEFFSLRKKKIQESLELAESSVARANERLERIEKQRAELEGEIAEITAHAEEAAKNRQEEMLDNAKQEAERIKNQAATEIENKRRQAIAELKEYAVDLALAEAEKTIRESITEGERKKLFADFSTRMGVGS